jgi:hypothetical protein
MLNVAAKVATAMRQVAMLLDVLAASVGVAQVSPKGFRSKHPLARAALSLQQRFPASSALTTVVHDGAYLTLCADFELALRELVIRYVEEAQRKCPDYNHLPQRMRDWYPRGCGELLVNLSQDRFRHLTQSEIHRSLASCLGSPAKSYFLVGDAYAYNNRNFWPNDLAQHFDERLGIPKIWQKLSRNGRLQVALGCNVPATAEMLARKKLEGLLSRRNDIVHRGKLYYTASDSEVRAAASYCTDLTQAVAEMLVEQLAAI